MTVTTETWDGLLGNYLKATDLKNDKDRVTCLSVEVDEGTDGKAEMELTVEYAGKKKIFSLNMTNRKFIMNSGIKKPSDIVGKIIEVKKVLVTNPTSKQEVESLRITAVIDADKL